LSVLAFCDGKLAVPLLPCRDHKRRFDGDKGPNTGGMGAICPPADATDALVQSVLETVLQPTVDGMAAEGMPFRGVLYAGVMLTESGPKVLEFNVRFGDPECQPLMLMLDEDIVPLMLSAAAGELEPRPFKWRPGAACCVVMASGGYPGPIEKGHIITGVAAPQADAVTFFAGAQSRDGILSTAGGRVLGVTTFGSDLKSAATRAYEQVSKINFEAAVWRSDIGGTR
jgi:phosphoribosylamine--glycine ligase